MAATSTRFNFTAESVKAIKPTDKRIEYWDENLSGFGVRVTPLGVMTWFYWYRLEGRTPRRWSIGRFPQVSLADARDQAKKAYGKDPAGQKSAARQAKQAESEARQGKTVGALAAEYLRVHAKPTKKTWKRDQEWIERYILPAWRQELARDISRKKIQALIDAISNPDGNNAPQSARVVKLLLSKMFNFSLLRDYDLEFNPVQGTQAPKGRKRNRFLIDTEIAKLLTALGREVSEGRPLLAHWFLLILLTAQRPGEVAAMRWDQLDIFDKGNEGATTGWWNVRTSKNGDPIHAALSPEAVGELRALRQWSVEEHERVGRAQARRRAPRPMSTFVFPAGDTANEKSGSMRSDQWPATQRVREAMGTHDWSPHDLRRTASTMMARLKVTRFIIDRVLNHTDATVGGIYDRFTYTDERMEAVTKLGVHIAGFAKNTRLLPPARSLRIVA